MTQNPKPHTSIQTRNRASLFIYVNYWSSTVFSLILPHICTYDFFKFDNLISEQTYIIINQHGFHTSMFISIIKANKHKNKNNSYNLILILWSSFCMCTIICDHRTLKLFKSEFVFLNYGVGLQSYYIVHHHYYTKKNYFYYTSSLNQALEHNSYYNLL